MSPTCCNVLYVNRLVRKDRVVRSGIDANDGSADGLQDWESLALRDNIRLLLETVGDVYVCATGAACITQLFSLQDGSMVDLKPTIILIDTPHDEPVPDEGLRSRSPSPRSEPPETATADVQVYPEEEVYGLRLLQKIVSEAHLRNVSSLVVPIALVSSSTTDSFAAITHELENGHATLVSLNGGTALDMPSELDRRLLRRCLDLGAADVMVSPMHTKSITALEIHAYRAHKDAVRDQQAMLEIRRGRKRSWVGISDNRPFAYLREAMVSNLMKMICQLGGDTDSRSELIKVSITPDKKARVAQAIAQWHFCAHDFSDDELIVAASLMFKHALALPELEKWRIATDQLTSFLVACRAAYNNFVPYHNFRHVVDVLQATFSFLIHIGALPAYPSRSTTVELPIQKSPIAELITPFEALTLLITAIGHDVGHPGVNNGFLVVLNTPLAQLYNDRSVLESFHCAAYSQILRRYWPVAFEDSKMRNLMISSILATDMGLHFDYMKRLGDLQEKLHDNNSTEGWNGRTTEEQRALACALLIKCADISNVARKHDTALKWTHILSDEFSRQASMETEAEIPTSLMAPPKKDLLSLSKAQLGFMNLFALPLFQGVADIMPPMQYTVDEMETNKRIFHQIVEKERAKEYLGPFLSRGGTFSPRTMSMAVSTQSEKELSPPPIHMSLSNNKVLDTNSPELRGGCSPEQANPTAKPSHIPDLYDDYKQVDGACSALENATDGIHPDSFDADDRRHSFLRKQRCSEATDGSASVPGGGDWASQATSATTGKMPISPSTQGTSIVSRDSLDRQSSVPVTTVTAPESSKSYSDPKIDVTPTLEDDTSVSSNGNGNGNSNGKSPDGKSLDGKTLKKKTSRFRINALNLFRRHKGTSPPLPAADAVS